MGLMVATAKCFLNGNLYQPGDKFEYDGPPGSAFHEVGAEPPVLVEPTRITSADAQTAPVDKALKAALERAYADILNLEGQLAESRRINAELSEQLMQSKQALEPATGTSPNPDAQAAGKPKK